jgi:hypothetical protein
MLSTQLLSPLAALLLLVIQEGNVLKVYAFELQLYPHKGVWVKGLNVGLLKSTESVPE